MRRSVTVFSLATILVAASPAWCEDPADAKKELDAFRAELAAIEKDAAPLKRKDVRGGNAALKKCAALANSLLQAKHKADPEWVPTFKQLVALEDKVQEAVWGKKSPHAPDDATKKGASLVEAAVKAVEAQPAGDAGAASGLLADLGKAKKTLMGASPQASRSDEWIEAFGRVHALEAKVQARGAEAAATPPVADKPKDPAPEPKAPTPGDKPAAPAELKLVKGERPPRVGKKESRLEAYVYPALDSAAYQLELATPENFAGDDAFRSFARKFEYAIAKMEKALEPYVSGTLHPDVEWCQRWIAAYRARVASAEEAGKKLAAERAAEKKKQDDAAAAAAAKQKEDANRAAEAQESTRKAEAKEIGARLDELNGYFGKGFKTWLEAPFTAERLRAWIADLKSWRTLGAKGVAELDQLAKEHPAYAQDPRITGLRQWFLSGLEKSVSYGIDRTVRWYDAGSGSAPGGITALSLKGDRLLDWNPFPEDKLSSHTFVGEALDDLQQSIQACELLALFSKEYEGKPDPKNDEHLAKLVAMKKRIEDGATKAFANVRMPAAATADAVLVAIAKKVLALPETEALPCKRLVITKDKQHYVEQRSNTTDAGDKIIIRRWSEEYDWFEVATAEKIGDHWTIVFYQLRRYTKALKGDSTYEWYCAVRKPWRRIPEENIEK